MFNIQIFVITTERCKQHQCQESDFPSTCFCVVIQGALPRRAGLAKGHSWGKTQQLIPAPSKIWENSKFTALTFIGTVTSMEFQLPETSKFSPRGHFRIIGVKDSNPSWKNVKPTKRCLCFTQTLTNSDHSASKLFSANTTAGRWICLEGFNDIFTVSCNSSGSGNEGIKQCQALNKACGCPSHLGSSGPNWEILHRSNTSSIFAHIYL